MTDLTTLTAAEARAGLDAKDFSAVDLTEAHLARIEVTDGEIHAFLHVMHDVARAQAAAADARIAAGDATALTGIPVALKDILVTTDAPTTAASRILEGYVSPYDGTVVSRLRDQGAVFIGKTNTDEFAMGSSTENSAFGPTLNPWDTTRVPGGSSGGSAASVAARQAVLSLGSDTGGSIRQPAGFCGVVGLKPTYGRVSRYGLIAFASSLDQIGPFARTVEDAAIMLGAIAGKDPSTRHRCRSMCPTTGPPFEPTSMASGSGLPASTACPAWKPASVPRSRRSIAQLEALGAELVEVSLPHTEYALATYYITAPAEASANLSRFDGVKYGVRARESRPSGNVPRYPRRGIRRARSSAGSCSAPMP